MGTDTHWWTRGRHSRAAAATLIGCCALYVGASTDAQGSRTDVSQPWESAFQGRVVEARTGTPVGNAIITVGMPGMHISGSFNPGVDSGSGVRSDSSGRFVVTGGARSRYSIKVSADGYLPGAYGQMWPGGPERVFDARRAGNAEELVVRMWRFASLSGTVVFEDGTPAPGVAVSPIPRGNWPLERPSETASPALTDGRGEYRISGLAPGRYAVAVPATYSTLSKSAVQAYERGGGLHSPLGYELRRSNAPLPTGEGTVTGDVLLQAPRGLRPLMLPPGALRIYRTVFFQDTISLDTASVITLRAGDSRTDVNFRLRSSAGFRVSGVVLDADGPSRLTGIHLVPVGRAADDLSATPAAASSLTDSNGTFTMLGVAPGEYDLEVLKRSLQPFQRSEPTRSVVNGVAMISGEIRPLPPDPDRPMPVLWARQRLVVSESDLVGVTVNLVNGARVTGTVEFDGTGRKPPARQLAQAAVILEPVRRHSQQIRVPVTAEGEFRSHDVPPGPYFVSFSQIPGWSVESARFGGSDASREAIDLSSGEYRGSIRLTSKVSTLIVEIRNGGDLVPVGATIFVFPAADWSKPLACFRVLRASGVASPAQRSGPLPPGDYSVVAVRNATFDFDWRDREVLEALSNASLRVTLRQGQDRKVSLPLIDMN